MSAFKTPSQKCIDIGQQKREYSLYDNKVNYQVTVKKNEDENDLLIGHSIKKD